MRGNISLRALLVFSVAVAIIGIAAGPAGAVVILSEDFESPVVSGYAKKTIPDNGQWISANQGYKSDHHGLINQDGGDFTTSDGNQAIAFRYTNSGVTTAEDVIADLAADVTYTVAFDVIRDGVSVFGSPATPYTVQLLAIADGAARNDCRHIPADSTRVTYASGNAPSDYTWQTITFTYSADSSNPDLGKDLAVRLIGGSDSAIIDNVIVDATAGVYWDLNGSDPNSGSTAPDGRWNAVDPNWNVAADGTGSAGVWLPRAAAVFAAGDDATGTYIVTVDGTQDIGGLRFEEGTVTLANGTAGELRMTSFINTMEVASGLIATVALPISDDGNSWTLSKAGDGTLVLSGANTYTGATTVQAGTLLLGASDVIPDTSDVTVNGTLDLAGNSDTIASLALGTGATVTTGAGTLTLGGDVAYNGSGAGATISGSLALGAAARTVTVGNASAADDLTISADMTGSGGIIKKGDGKLVLSGNNASATGGTTINAGPVQYESAAAICGSGVNVTVNAGGAVAFGASFDADLDTTLVSRIVASSAGAIAADNYDANDFDFDTLGFTAASLGAVGDVTYTGTLTPSGTTYRVGGGGGTLTMANANAVTGAGNSLVVGGPGTVVLANSNDYDGTTTISSGALQMGDAAALGTSQNLGFSTASTGKLQLYGYNLTLTNLTSDGGTPVIENGAGTDAVLTVNNSSDLSYGGTLQNGASGKLTLTKEGAGALTLSGSANQSSTTVNAGTLRLGASNLIVDSATVMVNANGTLDMNGYGDTISKLEGSGNVTSTADASTLTLKNGGSFTFDGVISGDGLSLTYYDASDTLTLTGQSTYGGATRVGLGNVYNVTLKLGVDNALPSGTPLKADGSGACALDLNGYNQTIGLLSLGSNNGGQRGKVIDSVGGGTLTLTDGVFCDSHNNGNGGIYVTTVDLNGADQVFRVKNGSGAVDLDVTSVIQNGGLIKREAGVLGLSGELTYAGDTVVEAGTLRYDNVGDGLDDASTVNIFADALMDLNFTVTDMIGGLIINSVSLDDGTYGSSTPTYGSFFIGTGSLTVLSSLPGDADGNGVVNAADYIILKRNMGQPATAGPADGDFNKSGTVDYDDLQLLIGNYDAVSGGSPAIPEPGSAILLMFGAAALLRRRRG